jgi:cytochrome P450
LFIAGHETTTNLIGNGTLALLRHRDQLEALRGDPTLGPVAVEELLRFDSPVQITARTATEDLEVNGIPLRQGEGVVCGLAAANRDPRYVADPAQLCLARGAAAHASFSNGMHHCLGAPLARLEGQVAFAALAQRFPGLELADDQPPYRDHFVLRGLEALPVSTGAR